jgi:hypothetical protein
MPRAVAQHLEARLLVLQQERDRPGIRMLVDAEGSGACWREIARPRRRRARRVIIEPKKARMVRPEARIERTRRHAELASDHFDQLEGERVAFGVEPRDRDSEPGQRARPLRHDRTAVGRAVVVDLFPVARLLGQLAVIKTPWVLRGSNDRPLSRQRQSEKLAHLAAQRDESAIVDAVADGLKDAPLAARGIDLALRVRVPQVADVDYG